MKQVIMINQSNCKKIWRIGLLKDDKTGEILKPLGLIIEMSDFSALSSIDSNLNSLSEELILNVNRDESIAFAVESSTGIDELADKLI